MGIIYEKRDHIAYLTINNPDHANTMDSASAAELTEAYKDVWNDRDVRVAILTGTGNRFFSAGHRLSKEESAEGQQRSTVEDMFWPQTAPATRFGTYGMLGHDEYPQVGKPILAAINGLVAGWGFFHLLSTTDLRIACREHGMF